MARRKKIRHTPEFYQKMKATALAKTEAATVNRRIDKLVNTYGFDSLTAQKAMASIIDTVPSANIKYVHGVPHIIKPAQLAKERINIQPLKEDVQTIKEVRSEAAERYETYLFEQEFSDSDPVDIDTFIEKKEKFEMQRYKIKNISEDPNSIENGDIIIKTLKSPLNTYEELFNISDQLEDYEV